MREKLRWKIKKFSKKGGKTVDFSETEIATLMTLQKYDKWKLMFKWLVNH